MRLTEVEWDIAVPNQAQETRHLQPSERIVQKHGCTSSSTFESNVQSNKICAIRKKYGLRFELRKDFNQWALKALSDSDFASDKGKRISGFGYIIYFRGIPIEWRSKGMKTVVLSTTEAEYMALSEVVTELKFIVQLLQTMNIEVELPIALYVDNVGAIWLSNNRTTSDRTKHIDIRTSFVKEYQVDGNIIIKFVKSEDNEANTFTKNTTNVIFQNHEKKIVWDKVKVNKVLNQELIQNENQQEGC